MLQGDLIALQPYTLERCHEFWKEYVPDPDMWEQGYAYDYEGINRYYQSKVKGKGRRFFAVCHNEKTVGEIQLKYIDPEQGCATLSIHFSNDEYKNRGWGTEAVRLLVNYAFEELGLHTIYADCVHRNKRSRHVLEKNGFAYLREDEALRYYVLKR